MFWFVPAMSFPLELIIGLMFLSILPMILPLIPIIFAIIFIAGVLTGHVL